MNRIAVLISGNGSNLQSLIDAGINIVCVISNNQEAYGLVRAKQANIPYHVIDHTQFKSRAKFDHTIHKTLLSYEPNLICLAGFMRVLGIEFINRWPNQIINIHPSLLPKFKGMHAIKQALDAKEKYTGCTIHYVNNTIDDGVIIAQKIVPILVDDNLESLTVRIHQAEHGLYPEVILRLLPLMSF